MPYTKQEIKDITEAANDTIRDLRGDEGRLVSPGQTLAVLLAAQQLGFGGDEAPTTISRKTTTIVEESFQGPLGRLFSGTQRLLGRNSEE